jgi:hypothetical protein
MTEQSEDRDVATKRLAGRLSEEGLLEAREFLRDLQARNPTIAGRSRVVPKQSTMDPTLAQLSTRKSFHLRLIRGLLFATASGSIPSWKESV